MKTRWSAVQGLWDEHRLCVSARLRGREVGGVEMVLLDAFAPGGRLASLSDSLAYGTLFGRLALRVGNGLDPVSRSAPLAR
jgi:hypothetical protein